MIKARIIFWRDIPVQVKVRNGRICHTQPLSPRFQQAVHRAAYRGKAISGDAYVQEWRLSDWQEREGILEEVVMAITTENEIAYSDDRLDKLAHNKGYEPHED